MDIVLESGTGVGNLRSYQPRTSLERLERTSSLHVGVPFPRYRVPIRPGLNLMKLSVSLFQGDEKYEKIGTNAFLTQS